MAAAQNEEVFMFSRPFIWAHRGASCEAPENTIEAFIRAAELGADGIELDVHLSRDGVPVVIHDDTVDRTTNGRGPVTDLTYDELSRLDAGSWFSSCHASEPVPGLSDVLQIFSGHLRINIEIKEARAGEAVLTILSDFPRADVVISSFDPELLRVMRRLAPALPLAVLLDRGNWRRAVKLALELGAIAFHPNAALVSRPLIAACRASNLPVHTWTVDDTGLVRSLQRAGIDGIFTNDPARFTVKGALRSKCP